MNTRVSIIIPTYKEEENIGKMLTELQKIAPKNRKYDFSIIIVDDNSPDSTESIVNDFQKRIKSLYLLTGPRRGLGTAVIRGIKLALKKMEPDMIVTIDADFAVSPKSILKMLKKIEEGADVVIASRHVPGGKTIGWPKIRHLIHFTSNTIFGRHVAGITQVSDLNSLTRAIRVRGVLDRINLNSIKIAGFGFLYYFIFRLSRITNKFYEIPLTFYPRKRGSSKIRLKDILEYIKISFRIRFERIRSAF